MWYTLDKAKAEEELATSIDKGLTREDADERLIKYGPNELAQKKSRSLILMFLDQFKDFMVIILIVAAIISMLVGERTDSIIIFAIIILNAVLGMTQESRAEQSLAALKRMTAPVAKVIRGGMADVIPASSIVPGDIVLLEAGDFVPADLRLIETVNMNIQEATLTGESMPVEKDGDLVLDGDTVLGDRYNMAYSGTMVTHGRGRGIVVATGMDTELGSIAGMLGDEGGQKTPLQERLNTLSKTMGIAVIGICGLIFIVGLLYGKELFEMFLTAVSLAVAAIPEGMLAIVTIVLAVGVQNMSKRGAIIRKLPAVETLGSATVICSDKTGTLTQNKMTVSKMYVDDELHDTDRYVEEASRQDDTNILMTIGMLCNNTEVKIDGEDRELIGDPTETALVDLGIKAGLDKNILEENLPRVDELPFDSERKLMTTVHRKGEDIRVFTKGAVDELLERCTHILVKGDILPIDDTILGKIRAANDHMGGAALRVLAMAYKEGLSVEELSPFESNLIFVGLVGIIDPPREEAKRAVELCMRAGIRPIMITGDHKITAVAIAKTLGIMQDGDEAISGFELEEMSDEELKANIQRYSVYARVAPEHKVRIVKAWQSLGHVVAMTGDGVNDAPALKAASIGAAMGITGTDVTKEAADMVITDDNFATIVSAVEEGRKVYANILKCIQYLLSCNVGEILLIFIATLLNFDQPLLPIHILWINLVTDSLPALALGLEPADSGVMDKKPRDPDEDIFTRGLVRRVLYQGAMVGLLSLTAFLIGSQSSVEIGETMTFAVLAFSQIVHGLNVRSNEQSIFKVGLFSNKYYLGAATISIGLQLLVLNVPVLMNLFKVTPLTGAQMGVVAILSLMPIVIVEVLKLVGLNIAQDEK